jgi:hypothetical protein
MYIWKDNIVIQLFYYSNSKIYLADSSAAYKLISG